MCSTSEKATTSSAGAGPAGSAGLRLDHRRHGGRGARQRRRQVRHRGGARRHHLGHASPLTAETVFQQALTRTCPAGIPFRGSTSVQIGAVAFAHQAVAVESQHFVDQLATVVAVVDHQRRLAAVDADDLELEVGLLGQRGRPVLPQRGLTAHHSPTLGHHARGHRRGEQDVVVEVFEHRLDIVCVPGPHPLVRVALRVGSWHDS